MCKRGCEATGKKIDEVRDCIFTVASATKILFIVAPDAATADKWVQGLNHMLEIHQASKKASK